MSTALGYFPGCSLEGSASEYDRSLRALAARLGTELLEVPDWMCCGASSGHAVDRDAALVLAASTLGRARRAGLDEVLAPCAMCWQRLATASHELRAKPALAGSLTRALGDEAAPGLEQVKVLSGLAWLAGLPEGVLAARVVRPLRGLRVASYTGCLLARPAALTGGAERDAVRDLDRLVAASGAEPVRWPLAADCCGGSFAVSRKEVVLRQSGAIVAAARRAGADVLCVACPMCHANLDLRQRELPGAEAPLPVVYVTQLLALAAGVPEGALGLDEHLVPVAPALDAARARGGGGLRPPTGGAEGGAPDRKEPPCRG